MRLGSRSILFLASLVAIAATCPPPASTQAAPRVSMVERVRALGVDSVTRGVRVYHSPGARQRAEAIGPMVAEAIQFFADSLGVRLNLRVALVDSAGWSQISPYPFGLPFVITSDSVPIAVLPAERRGVIYDDFVTLQDAISPALRDEFRATGLSWEESVGRMVDLIGFHEIGHAVAYAYGIGRPAHWFNEFIASYFAYAFMDARRPEFAKIWDLLGRAKVEGYEPTHRTLADFERLYAGVGPADYGWYQSVFEVRANPLVRAQGLRFAREVRRIFPNGVDRLPYTEVLRRLEAIAPGFERWAQVHF